MTDNEVIFLPVPHEAAMFTSPIDLRSDVRAHLKKLFSQYLSKDMDVYDIGCGDKPFSSFLAEKVKKYIGVDVESGFYDASHIDIIGTACKVPAPDGCADAVISSQVIEHLEKPLDFFDEASRLLKGGGYLFLSYPFLYPLHAEPYDYGRYTHFFIHPELEKRDFEIIESMSIGGFWYCVGMYAGMYLQNIDRGLVKKIRLSALLIWLVKALTRIAHEIEGYGLQLLKKSPEDFRRKWTVNYVLLARKKLHDG